MSHPFQPTRIEFTQRPIKAVVHIQSNPAHRGYEVHFQRVPPLSESVSGPLILSRYDLTPLQLVLDQVHSFIDEDLGLTDDA